ncbi:MAG: ISL3 family transposase [Chloroflexi bacterium]|nr:MAG: ISL3 family transposase [Chloroflexota bacterium]TME64175.1 MAG: ISL3 family transposase [Chloroflexota bacterium]
MPTQHSTEKEASQEQGIVVPLELEGLRILKQEVQADGRIRVEVMGTNERAACPHCGAVCVKEHDVRQRIKRDVPLRGHRVELVLHKRRFWCIHCHKAFTESDSACGRRKRTTLRLREEIGQQACSRPLMHVASHYQVGPRFVQACLETVASTQLAKRGLSLEESGPLPTPRFLGIDEFARRKGHRYDTLLCDLEARQVLEVSAGRKKDEVASVLERLSNCDGVEAVSMDMSTTFREAVQLCLPRARIVADHFHVIQHVNKAVNKVIGRWAKKEEGKHALEGQRHLFLRNQEDLSAEDEQSRATLAAAFPEIGTAWQLKEALRTWYAEASAETAAAGLDRWIAAVKGQGPKELRQALSAFRNWRQEILAFFDFLPTRLSNGFVEGKNNRTKALMRQGFGYSNRRHLRLRILLEVA